MSDLDTDNEDYFRELVNDITIDEARKAINQTHNTKSVGLDNLPCELFKNNGYDEILTLLFNKIFLSIWNLVIIKPIPKNTLADPRLPLEHQGISLLSTLYKLFTSVLNKRIVQTAETNSLYSDEQNGLQKNRSCEDHLFTLSSIIRIRKHERLFTYISIVDFEKAFDRVDRNFRFLKTKINGP